MADVALVRLTIKVEHSKNQPNFGEAEFSGVVENAVRTVLGQGAPLFEVADYDSTTKKGSIVVEEKDVERIWAALSVYGRHFGKPITLHFNNLTKATEHQPEQSSTA